MTTMSSNCGAVSKEKKLEALHRIATGGAEIDSFRLAVLWLRSIHAVGNFKIGQIDTKPGFLNSLLTFGNYIPINHNMKVSL